MHKYNFSCTNTFPYSFSFLERIFVKFCSDLEDSDSPQIWLQSCRQWNQGVVDDSSGIVPSLGRDPLSSLPNIGSHGSTEMMSVGTNKIEIYIFSK